MTELELAEALARIAREHLETETLTGEERRERLELLETEAGDARKLADRYREIANLLSSNHEIQMMATSQRRKAAETELGYAKAMLSSTQAAGAAEEANLPDRLKAVKIAQDNLAIAENLEEQLKKTVVTLKDSLNAAEDLGTSLGKAMALPGNKNFFGTMQKMSTAMRSMISSTDEGVVAVVRSFGTAAINSVFESLVNNTLSMVINLVDMENSFRRATGANQDFAKSVTKSYEQTRQFGVTSEEASAAAQALYGSYTDFTMLDESTRVGLQNTIGVLSKYGIAMEDLAKGTQVATKMFGISAGNVEKTHREIATFAKEIGVAPSQMAQQFAAAGPSLAKFGSDGVRVFKELQRTSKITGMEMDKLLQITNKFDTFEGAATQAGKLNAALGGNFVNAMDLMMATDPMDRFDQIRGAIEGAGLSFDTMSYYQRNFYKDALGLDSVGDLALVLSGNQNALAGSTHKTADEYEDMANVARDVQGIQEQLNAALAAATPVLKPLIGGIQTLLKYLGENQWVLQAVIAMTVGYKSALMALNIAQIINTALTARQSAVIFALTAAFAALAYIIFVYGWGSNFAEAMIALGFAFWAASKMIDKMSKSSVKAAPVLLALGTAMLFIGAGVYLAASGLANLAGSFKDLGDAAPYAAAAIITFTLAFTGLMALLIFLVAGPQAVATTAAVAVLLSVGAAALLIGAGMGVAALGMAELVKSIGSLELAGLDGIGLTMAALAASLVLFANPATLVGLTAVGLYAIALSSLSESIKPINELLVSMVKLSNVSLKSSIGEVSKLMAELQKVEPAKAKAFTNAMKAATTHLVDVRQAPASPLQSQSLKQQPPASPLQSQSLKQQPPASPFQPQRLKQQPPASPLQSQRLKQQPAKSNTNTTVQLKLDAGTTRKFWEDLVEKKVAEVLAQGI